MELSNVGKRIFRSYKSARSHALRPQVPARAAAAAAVARAIATLPPHDRLSLPSNSDPLTSSIYGSRPRGQSVQHPDEFFFKEEFDAIRHDLEHIPEEDNELEYLENTATLRLAQLDKITECLSHHVMEHHEEMVRGLHLVKELERDLKIATIICMNGRRHLTSSMNEVSRDLIVTSNSKKKQVLLEMLPILTELCHARDIQKTLERHIEEGNYSKAFQVLSEYLQLLDSLSELSVVQEMSRDVEVWLGKTLQKLDSLLVQVCQEFKEDKYITVIDAYALIGDISGLAEKIQSFFMQNVLSETHYILKTVVQDEDEYSDDSQTSPSSRMTFSDLCPRIPEPMFRICLIRTLSVLFKIMSSYHSIMICETQKKIYCSLTTSDNPPTSNGSVYLDSEELAEKEVIRASSFGSPWDELRRDATAVVSDTLDKARNNIWQLMASRVSVLLSSTAFSSTSIHQFLKNYEDLNVFILAGEAFCGVEASDFRSKLKAACGSYFGSFHRQNMHALKMVLEKEKWQILPQDVIQIVSFAGLFGDGAPLLGSSDVMNPQLSHSTKLLNSAEMGMNKSSFSQWFDNGNPFLPKLASPLGNPEDQTETDKVNIDTSNSNGNKIPEDEDEDEDEDLLADFIDEDSQLPSRTSPILSRTQSLQWRDNEAASQTGSSLCLLRFMDKYARLMLKLELANVILFKGICQLFEVYYFLTYQTFGQPDAHGRLKTALTRITQDCEHWIKPHLHKASSSPPASLNGPDLTPMIPPHCLNTSFGLQERCAAADALCNVAQILYRSKSHLQSMLLQHNAAIVEDFFVNLVNYVPDLVEHIHRTTAKMFLHVNGYVERIANSKWELKELGMEHNRYIDLLLGEFRHYKKQLGQGGIPKEVQNILLDYGVEVVAQTLVEGLSRVKRCTNEGRALMSLDLQVLINGLQRFDPKDVKQKLQTVMAFIKAFYLPETEYVQWANAHPEYTKSQVVGLINLVATMKGWKRKTRLELLEKIDA
ncbi:hypothetical protein V2J09_019254 [Rumex salicifolius]